MTTSTFVQLSPAATFVYCPKSGDRMVAENIVPASDVYTIRWPNGSRHVVGGIRLQYAVALPGEAYWHTPARVTARAVIAAVGGIAWDDGGVIDLVVPVRAAAAVDRLMRAARPAAAAAASEDDVNLARLVAAGWGLELVGGQLVVRSWQLPTLHEVAEPVGETVAVLGWSPSVEAPEGMEPFGWLQLFRPGTAEPVMITVPYEWAAFGRPAVAGARLEVGVDEVDRPTWRPKRQS